jgi:hypothetical protein
MGSHYTKSKISRGGAIARCAGAIPQRIGREKHSLPTWAIMMRTHLKTCLVQCGHFMGLSVLYRRFDDRIRLNLLRTVFHLELDSIKNK